jgi:hypothetical protein
MEDAGQNVLHCLVQPDACGPIVLRALPRRYRVALPRNLMQHGDEEGGSGLSCGPPGFQCTPIQAVDLRPTLFVLFLVRFSRAFLGIGIASWRHGLWKKLIAAIRRAGYVRTVE